MEYDLIKRRNLKMGRCFLNVFPLLACLLFSRICFSEEPVLSGRLPRSYYSKNNALEPGTLSNILAKDKLEPKEGGLLTGLFENSSVSRLRQIGKSIQIFVERGEIGDDVILLTELKKLLAEQRAAAFNNLVQNVHGPGSDPVRVAVLGRALGTMNDDEVLRVFSTVPSLLTSPEGDRRALFFTIVYIVSERKLMDKVKDSPASEAMISALEKWSETTNESSSLRETSRHLLVRLGAKAARRLIEDAIARSKDPKADLTALSASMPEALALINASQNPAYLSAIPAIGENIKRIRHQKLRQGFFNHIGFLLRTFKHHQDGDSVGLIEDYLRQAEKSEDLQWSKMARHVLVVSK